MENTIPVDAAAAEGDALHGSGRSAADVPTAGKIVPRLCLLLYILTVFMWQIPPSLQFMEYARKKTFAMLNSIALPAVLTWFRTDSPTDKHTPEFFMNLLYDAALVYVRALPRKESGATLLLSSLVSAMSHVHP